MDGIVLLSLGIFVCTMYTGIRTSSDPSPRAFTLFVFLSVILIVSILGCVVTTIQFVKPGRSHKEKIRLLIAVASAVNNSDRRETIRKTWGSLCAQPPIYYDYPLDQKINCSVRFFIGKSRNPSDNAAILKENVSNGDIFVGEFIDHFLNLTAKSLFVLEKFLKLAVTTVAKTSKRGTEHISFTHLLKIEDDVFLNVPLTRRRLLGCADEKELLLGSVMKHQRPRNEPGLTLEGNDLAPTAKEFTDRYYPTYLQGFGYLMSKSVANCLLNNSYNEKSMGREDVFVTGICAQYCRVHHRHDPGFIHSKQSVQLPHQHVIHVPVSMELDKTILFHIMPLERFKSYHLQVLNSRFDEQIDCPSAIPI